MSDAAGLGSCDAYSVAGSVRPKQARRLLNAIFEIFRPGRNKLQL